MNESQISELFSKLDTLIRLIFLEISGKMTAKEKIFMLNDIGFKPKQISEILNITPNNVSVTLSRKRKIESVNSKPTGGDQNE